MIDRSPHRNEACRWAVAVVALTLALASSTIAAATYRWTDDNGRVHYSDNPPLGVDAERLGPALPTAAAPEVGIDTPAGTPHTEALEQDAARRAAEEKAYNDSQAQIAATKQRNCRTARANLRKLRADGDVMVPSSSGGRKLGDAERQRMIRDSQARVRENCTP